jgi:putative tryptophan/tyrosine transport system substrate-binding protein
MRDSIAGRFLVGVVIVLTILGAAFAVAAQTTRAGKPARIGRLSPNSLETDVPHLDAFRKGLRELGWVEGQDFAIETRFAGGNPDRLPELAAQLVRERVDLILAGSTPGVLAAKGATTAIPIVMVTTGDPIDSGLVASLAQPGGNVTGVTALGQALSAKRLELLKEAVPGVTRVAVLTSPGSPYTGPFLKDRANLAQALGLRLQVVEAREPSTFERAFAEMARERAGALMVFTDAILINHRRRLVELAAKHRLPAVYPDREFVNDGGLMFYGASLVDMYHHAAVYADRILKGAKPASLPVEQPTKLELVINLKTAKGLGLTIPPSLLAKADHVVE